MNESEWNPGKLLELSGYYWKSFTLHAAVKLAVFTLIGEESLTAKEIAQRLGSDERGTTILLNALAAMNLVHKEADRFMNSAGAKIFLVKTSVKYIGYMIMHHHHLAESWNRIDEAVTSGKPVRTSALFGDERRLESFLMGMFNMAMSMAPGIASLIDLTDRSTLLDLGGGPGTYAINFCLTHPKLRAVIFDLPQTRPFAEKTVKRFDLSDRIVFQDGDFLKDDLTGKFDVVWLSHILHGEGPSDCSQIIKKAVSTLKPGGMILIHDFILKDSMDGPLFPALFGINMLVGTQSGQSYSEAQIVGMLHEAGVTEIKRIPYVGPPESGIIKGQI